MPKGPRGRKRQETKGLVPTTLPITRSTASNPRALNKNTRKLLQQIDPPKRKK